MEPFRSQGQTRWMVPSQSTAAADSVKRRLHAKLPSCEVDGMMEAVRASFAGAC